MRRLLRGAPAGLAAAALAASALAVAALAACGSDVELPPGDDPVEDPDSLDVTSEPAPGSLDELHARILERRCSGQPGLCHNGQFEPNLSTPALTYAYLVNRPSLEKPSLLRVKPGDASRSLFIDKIRNRNSVATQMPLGAEPLAEEDVAALEKWINDGARRAPGAAAAPVLNNPPKRPQIAIYSAAGARLDGGGPFSVAAGATLVLRHSVHDFETRDEDIPFAAVLLGTPDGRNVVLTAGADPHVGPTTYDAAGPESQGERLNFRRSWTIGSTIELYNGQTGQRATVPAAGQSLTVTAVYIDAITEGIVALDSSPSTIQIQ